MCPMWRISSGKLPWMYRPHRSSKQKKDKKKHRQIFPCGDIPPGTLETPLLWTPEVKTLLSAFLLCQRTPLVYKTSSIPRHLRQPNPGYKKNSHRNRNNYQFNHSGDHHARTKILTRILSCFHNRNHAQGCHINSNSNISKPSLILSNANNQFNNFDQAFNMPNNTKRGLSNNCLNYASSSIDHNHIPKPYLIICPTELLHKSPLIYQNPIIIPHPPTNQITDLTL
ncbi:hypothetical protein AAG570_005811 [Ranatra chinensis]|uniref:Uncharacterized protein n=1 Tax=Ranatra chinensis TaxID=642074 RepID=A0ABD0XYK0_9HEMI